MEDGMDRTCSMHINHEKFLQKYLSKNLKRQHMGEVGVRRRIILKCFLKDQKQPKFQWLQNPSQTNGDNLNKVRCKTSRTFERREGISKK
jgi:hypothetical protein